MTEGAGSHQSHTPLTVDLGAAVTTCIPAFFFFIIIVISSVMRIYSARQGLQTTSTNGNRPKRIKCREHSQVAFHRSSTTSASQRLARQ